MTWPVTSQSNSMRIVASCCLTDGRAWVFWSCSTYAGDQHGFHGLEFADSAAFAPPQERDGVAEICSPGVRVADIGSEEFGEPGDGVLSGVCNDPGQSDLSGIDQVVAWRLGRDYGKGRPRIRLIQGLDFGGNGHWIFITLAAISACRVGHTVCARDRL